VFFVSNWGIQKLNAAQPQPNLTAKTQRAQRFFIICSSRSSRLCGSKVFAVNFVIATEQDQLIEQGAAVLEAGLWWKYATTTNAPGSHVKVIVHAWDLPGHEAVKSA